MANQPERSMNAPKGSLALVVFCGLLMGLSAFSIDVMLPAFLPMASDLNSNLAVVQSSIPAFMVPFATAQIFCGSASDRFGRKPVIIAGMIVYLIGALVSAIGGDVTVVLIGRAIQGIGAAAAPVVARAILRDTHSGAALGQAMATATGVFAVGPLLAPFVGYGFEAAYGWRFIFVGMGIVASALLVGTLFLFKETNAEKNPDALKLSSTWGAFRQLIGNRQSMTFLVIAGSAQCGLLSYIANSSRIYSASFGSTGFEFAYLFMISGFGIVVGQIANRWALPRFGILNSLRVAGLIVFTVSCLNAYFGYTQQHSAVLFTVLMFGFNTSFLVVLANSMTLILDPHPRIAGVVSALFGFITILIGAVYLLLTFDFFGGDIFTWSLGMIAATGISLALLLAVRRENMEYEES